jgi:hypothetical protein
MITKNFDANIYCDLCKNQHRNPDGTFKPTVRAAHVLINYPQVKGKVNKRAICAVCEYSITHLATGYWSLKDQIEYAVERWALNV